MGGNAPKRIQGAKRPCSMVVDWTVDERGEPDLEIECGREARFVALSSADSFCCLECHDSLDEICTIEWVLLANAPT